ncbi:MAG: serine/threonine-protein kinase [Deltaproteobacteria bacterium]
MAGSDSHDTDPLADTAAPVNDDADTRTKKKRAVHSGDTIGRYELGDDVGEGGMATVYRARDKELRREVAVKVLFPHLARRPEIVRRFHREARAAAGLEHANILRIYDVGGDEESDDPPFIVMELVRGTTLLGEIEQRGPMFAEVVACVGAVLADALAAAHAAGIIHRDIKPANVLVAPGGRVLLADFGVARLETEDSLVTKTGALLGTPAYMSPEQAAGDIATARSDLYSLGATLYQLATGTLPYAGSPAKVIAQIAAGSRIAAVKKRAEVGPDLSRVIDRLMATEPEDRLATAKEVAEELRAIAASGGLGEPADELRAYFADPQAFVAAKTPGVVTALIAAGKRAIADSKLPRALAIADRASALAPADPAVAALVTEVTEGGRSNARRRVLAIGLVGAAVIAGGALAGVKLLGSLGAAPADAMRNILVENPDASSALINDGVDSPAAIVMPELDAAVARDAATARDSGVVRARDASTLAVLPGFDAAVLADAAALVVAPPDAAPLPDGTITVKNDTWCDVWIDGQKRGRAAAGPFSASPGKHLVRCEQEGLHEWHHEVEVVSNRTVVTEDKMLRPVTVHFEIAASLGGTPHAAGETITVQPHRVLIEANGQKKYWTPSATCSIRDKPELDCYETVH